MSEHVFISYKTEERDFAQMVRANLALALKCDVWWDQDLQTGGEWNSDLDGAIRSAVCVVVLWSKESCKSPWVQQEAAVAKALGTLLPAMIEDCAIPAPYSGVQAARLQSWDFAETHPEFVKLAQGVSRLVEAARVERSRDPATDARPDPPLRAWLRQLSRSQRLRVGAAMLAAFSLAFNFGIWSAGLDLPYLRDLPWFPAAPTAEKSQRSTDGTYLAEDACEDGELLVSSEDSPSFAFARTVEARYGRTPSFLHICLDTASIRLREVEAGYNGPRTLHSLRAGVACWQGNEGRWDVLRFSQKSFIKKTASPGESIVLEDIHFIVPIAEIEKLHQCWVLFETEDSTDVGMGLSYAHSDRDFFKQ